MERKASNCRELRLFSGVLIILAVVTMVTASVTGATEGTGQRIFTSAQQAVDALVTAARENNDSELLAILGPGSEDIIASGDQVADQKGRAHFLKAYEKKNSLRKDSDSRTVLIVGNKNYPFPIPIVRQEKGWIFDTQAGIDEILNRRIGRNELHTIEVMHAYTDAQREYACMKPAGGIPEFAQKFASSKGKKDGLYWEAGEGEEESPIGPLIAEAAEDGYTGGLVNEPPEPFHGYYFKILAAQGKDANGGAFDYVVDGKMVLGFALVAYPAKYGASGVMTFLVNQEGVIYEKDLGEETVKEAEAMTTFNPDKTWHKYEESAEK